MLLGFSIFTGATFNLAKYTVGYFSPSSSAAWRFGLAAFPFLSLYSCLFFYITVKPNTIHSVYK